MTQLAGLVVAVVLMLWSANIDSSIEVTLAYQTNQSQVSEPGSLALLTVGLAMLGIAGRRRSPGA